jgi:hypothetical protein
MAGQKLEINPMQLRRFLFHCFLCIGTYCSSVSQPVEWNARWIMHPTVQPQAHAVVLFRNSFELAKKPDKFVVYLSADNQYRFFVNGRYISRGPARGDLSHWFYETLELSDYLQAGKNILAVEVVNWGPKRSFTFFSQMTTFIMQGDSDAAELVNTGEAKWKCIQNKAFNPIDVAWMTDRNTIDFGLYVGNPTDSIRGDLYPWGWETMDFQDNDWLLARIGDMAGTRGHQFAGGILYSGGKILIPRRAPVLKEQMIQFARIVRTTGIKADDGFLHGKGQLIIPLQSRVTLLIDQTYETIGYPEMTVSGGKDAKIRAMYAENLIVRNHAPKGNRNETDGKYLVGIKDIFIPDGGKFRIFKPTYLRSFRFIQLDIETRDETLIIEDYHQVSCQAQLELKAKFETDNSGVNALMPSGWRTASICAQDILFSDAAYEQMQYTGDSRVHNLTLLTLSGDDRLTRNALIQFDESRIPEGLTLACYPNPFYLVIPSYSLIWIDQLHDYMMWKDDREFISRFELGIYSVLQWFEKRRQSNGLLGKMEWWGALAWPRHYENGEPPGIYEGNNTLYTLQYAYTLRHAADIYEYLGKNAQAAEFRDRADQICRAVNQLCRNGEGFYTESPANRAVSQITNILAILAGATNGPESVVLMKKLLEPADWFGQVDLFLHLYLFEALNKTGLQDRFFSEISEWHTMMERGMTTFAEVPLEWGEENQRSECHPWSTSPNYFFFRTVCGIVPLVPGHKSVEIAPHFGELTQIKATYPHYLGNIEMDLSRTGDHVDGEITVPGTMQASFVWGGSKILLKSGSNRVRL